MSERTYLAGDPQVAVWGTAQTVSLDPDIVRLPQVIEGAAPSYGGGRMSSLQTGFPGFTRHSDPVASDLCNLLDTLVALRMDLGHDANGMDASPPLGPIQMQEIRRILDGAIVLTKEIMGWSGRPDGD